MYIKNGPTRRKIVLMYMDEGDEKIKIKREETNGERARQLDAF